MIRFFDLEPIDARSCNYCQLSYLELVFDGKRYVSHYRCRKHGDVGMDDNYNYVRPNDCPDFLSAWQNDYRKRPDLQRKLDKKEGGEK